MKNKLKLSLTFLFFFILAFGLSSCKKEPEIDHFNFPYRIARNLRVILYDHKVIPVNRVKGLRLNLSNYRRLTENSEIAPRGRALPAELEKLNLLLVRLSLKNTGKNRAYPTINWREQVELLVINHKKLHKPVYMLPNFATVDYRKMNYGNQLRNPKQELFLEPGKEVILWMGAPIPKNLFNPFYLSFKIKGVKEPLYNIEIN